MGAVRGQDGQDLNSLTIISDSLKVVNVGKSNLSEVEVV